MLDIIGTVHTPGTYDAEGAELTPPVALAGWHVNSPFPVDGWAVHQVEPASPCRVFGGHPTFFYVFESEEAFKALALEAGLIQPEPEPEAVE